MSHETSRKVFLVVAGGNPSAERHFEDTIQRKRTLDEVRRFLPAREIENLERIYHGSHFIAWGKFPAIIVIYNPSFLLSHHTEPHAIKAAMYGFDQLILGLSPIHMRRKPRLLDRKSGPGRKMGTQFNTTISAVSVINGEGLIIYHNVFAAIPLKVEVFSEIAVRQFMVGEKQPGEFETWQEVGPPNAS